MGVLASVGLGSGGLTSVTGGSLERSGAFEAPLPMACFTATVPAAETATTTTSSRTLAAAPNCIRETPTF